MTEENFKISDIIFAYLKGTITDGEEKILKEWLDVSEKHRALLDRLTLSSSFRAKREVYRRFDAYYDCSALLRYIRRKKHLAVWRHVAAAVLVFSCISGILYWRMSSSESETVLARQDALAPGKAVATLILFDGSEKKLDDESFSLMEGNRLVENRQNRLIYETTLDPVKDTIEKYHEVIVPRGGEYRVTLSDGTDVWLNSESSLRYPVEFKGREREVWIHGEVYFSVKKDTLHPFVVNSNGLSIRVLGTEFNVRAYKDESRVITTLVDGRVIVESGTGLFYELRPSQQLVYTPRDGRGEVSDVDTEFYVSWRKGIYLFETSRLEEIMTLISRWYDVHVFYQAQELKEITFSGRLKRHEDARSLLEVFEQLGGIQFTVNGNTVIVDTK